jgi:signal transduction histidine kinase
MNTVSFDMEHSIARCRVFLSLVAILAIYVDPTEPTLTRWMPLAGGAFVVDRYWITILAAHLAYSLTLVFLHPYPYAFSRRLETISTWADVLFAAAIALVTEGTTSPFYSFFAFAVLTAGLRSGLRAALRVTGLSAGLYLTLVIVSAPASQTYYIVMRATYIVITGYLVGYLSQERLNQEARIRNLESAVRSQRERIARSLHDEYAQALAGVNLRLETCRELLRRGQQSEALTELTELQAGVNREHDELRAYIRSLVDLDLTQAWHESQNTTQVSVQAEFHGSVTYVEHILLIMLEGLRNVRRHAHARSAVIGVRTVEQGIVLRIDDDGIGFPEGAIPPWSMVSRVAECGGQLTLEKGVQSGGHVLIYCPEA